MDDKSDINPANVPADTIEIDAIQKHVEESLLFLDDKKTANSDSENKDKNIVNDPTNLVNEMVGEPMELADEEENNTDLCKSNDETEKSSVPVETSIISSGMDNESLASVGQAQVDTEVQKTIDENIQNDNKVEPTQTTVSPDIEKNTKIIEQNVTASEYKKIDNDSEVQTPISSTQSNESPAFVEQTQTSTDNLEEMDEENIPNNDKLELTKIASSQKIVEEIADENDETAIECEKSDDDTQTTNTLSAQDKESSITVTDNPKKMDECENNELEISKEVDDPIKEGQGSSIITENVEQTGDGNDPEHIVDNIQEMDVTDSNSNENENVTSEQKIVWEHPVWEPVPVKKESNIEKMNEEEINAAQIEEASIEKPINNNDIILSDDEIEICVPDMDTIILDDINLESDEATTQAVEETSMSSVKKQKKADKIHKLASAKPKHVWESRVNDANEVIKKENIDSEKSVTTQNAPKTVISQENVDEVTCNENNAHISTQDVPLHGTTEKVRNSQRNGTSREQTSKPIKSSHSSSEKILYECTPAKRARAVSETVGVDSNTPEPVRSAYPASLNADPIQSEESQIYQEISLHEMREKGRRRKSSDHKSKHTLNAHSMSKQYDVIKPAKRARIEPDSSLDIDTAEIEFSEPGQSTSMPVQDLTLESDDEIKISEPALMSETDCKEFEDWAMKYLIKSTTKNASIPKILSYAHKHNKGVMRLGNLPKGYNYQDVYGLVKRTTKHAGTEIFKSIAFIYNDKSKNPPFNTAYIRWKNRDIILVVKAMELFKQASVKLKGQAITCKYDNRSYVDWDVNDRPIINKKSVNNSTLQPVRILPPPFVTGEVNYYDTKAYGLSKEFLDSLHIEPPLTCFVTVKNLDIKLDEVQVRKIFSVAGNILTLILEPDEGVHTARIEYDHPLEAVQAISMFDNQELHKKILNLSMEDSMPTPAIISEGFTELGPGLGKDGNVLKGIGVNNDIEQLRHCVYLGLKRLKIIVGSAKGRVQDALQAQLKINAERENKITQSTKEPVKDSISTQSTQQSPQDLIASLATALASSVQSNLMSALGFQPYMQGFTDQNQMSNCVSWSNPNAYDWTTMQTWMNMQGQNMQTWPNMQTGANMQTGPVMQIGANMQTGLNMQTGANMQTGPIMQTGANIQTVPNMQTGANIQTVPNMQTGAIVRTEANIQTGPNIQNRTALNQTPPNNKTASNAHTKQSNMQGAQDMQKSFNKITPLVKTRPNTQSALNIPTQPHTTTSERIEQTGPDMEKTAYMHMQQSYMQTAQKIQTITTLKSNSSTMLQANIPGPNKPTKPKVQRLPVANITIPTSHPRPKEHEGYPTNTQIESGPILYAKPSHNTPLTPSPTFQKSVSDAKKTYPEIDLTVKSVPTKRDAKGQSVSQAKPQVKPIPKAKSPQKETSWINKQIKAMRRNSKSPDQSRVMSPQYDKFKEGNRSRDRSRDRSRERESEKQKEIERRREADRKKEAERMRDKQREAERFKEKQREAERLKEKIKEIERKRDAVKEKHRDADRAKEKQRETERHRDVERTKEKQRDSDRYRDADYTRSARPLFFKHLPSSVTTEDLREKMGEIGKIVSAQVLGKGYAEVTYRNTEDAEQCIEMYHLSKVDSQTIEVKWK